MNPLYVLSFIFLVSYYILSLMGYTALAFSLFILTILSLIGAIIKHLGTRKKVPYLKLVK